jgi:hypothetical protein
MSSSLDKNSYDNINVQKCHLLANDMRDIKEMMFMLNKHIKKDSESLNKISENIEQTDAYLDNTNIKLMECSEIKQGADLRKIIFYGGIGSILGGCVGGPIGFAVGAKVGVISLVGGVFGGGLLGSLSSTFN